MKQACDLSPVQPDPFFMNANLPLARNSAPEESVTLQWAATKGSNGQHPKNTLDSSTDDGLW